MEVPEKVLRLRLLSGGSRNKDKKRKKRKKRIEEKYGISQNREV